MKRRFSFPFLILSLLLVASAGCNLNSNRSATPSVEFSRPVNLFGTPDPNLVTIGPTVTVTQTSTPFPTPTAVNWPPPYFGTPGPPLITPQPPPAPVIHNPEDFNVLLLGSDRRDITFATDVMLLVNFQPKYNSVSLISIPRTLVVYIPGWEMEKVNKAYQHGEESYYPGLGPALVKDTMLYNFGVEIDRYMLVDFNQFEEIINTLGGIDVPVACPYTDYHLISPNLDPEKEKSWALYTVPAGMIEMDGDLALWYARSRLKSNDFDRNRRQQELIRAIYSQALQLEMIKYIPTLYSQLSESVITDFTLYDALRLAPKLTDLGSVNIRSYYLDQRILTRWTNPYGQVMHVPNLQAMYTLFAEALGPPKEEVVEDLVVEIWNGTTINGLDSLASERLNYAGFRSNIGSADNTNHSQTLLYDFTEQGSPEQAQELLNLFNLGSENFAAVPTKDSPYDFLLILGTDFDPCFNPKAIDR
ncbi:MAG: LCP family protein [Anaerolineales bacterium]